MSTRISRFNPPHGTCVGGYDLGYTDVRGRFVRLAAACAFK